MTSSRRRLLIIGLDCVPPSLAFDRFQEDLPVLTRLRRRGLSGPLRSCTPPITIPAWACMTSGRDPGQLGLYGFRNRRPGSYEWDLASSRSIAAKRLWDHAGEAGRNVSVLFVPPCTPPHPVRGQMVACFLHDGDSATPMTYPPELSQALTERHGGYLPDVPFFRTADREQALETIYAMGRQHFSMARHCWVESKPDMMMFVEIGPDRFHHLFWRCFDTEDPRFDALNPWRDEGRRYYRFLNDELEKLLEVVAEDTVIMVVSDHGARPMKGGVLINQLLLDAGYLRLRRPPHEGQALSVEDVDWSRTRAWGAGGYYGRIFLNLKRRDPQGIVGWGEEDKLLSELVDVFGRLVDDNGRSISVVAERAHTLYRATEGIPPDLFLFFDDLSFRALGTFRHDRTLLADDDLGHDGCNHDWNGIFVLAGSDLPQGTSSDMSLFDVFQTGRAILRLDRPRGTLGVDRSILGRA